jgi:hypothetical protein
VGTGPGLSARNTDMDSLVELVVTVKGVKMLRGADVQITVQGDNAVPRAWQAHKSGCAAPFATFKPGSFGGAYPDIFTTGDQITNLIVGSHGMMYQYKRNMCATPDSTGTLWLGAAGADGVARDSSVEYGVFAIKLNLKAAAAECTGPALAADSRGVTLYVNNHMPCNRTLPRLTITLLDAAGFKDFVPVDSMYSFLTWKGGAPKGAKGGP